MRGMTRRTLFQAAAAGAAVAALPVGPAVAGAGRARPEEAASYRAAYHFTVPDQWKNDPQKPIWIDGEYHYYYLYNADYLAGKVGTAWRLATSTDLVSFQDRGIAVPKHTTPNEDVWSGCPVVDVDDTAGFGPGAVVVIATQAPGGTQAQYLWYSTDGGHSFTNHGTAPVLPNPGVKDFRDPKLVRDEEHERWVMLLTENAKVGIYHSRDLKEWTYASGFVKEGIGALECPDLFRITGADSVTKWVLGVSANGKSAGLPNTYAYWIGGFDGTAFVPDAAEPQWLDHGFDWYGAVTWEKHGEDGSVDPAVRYAMGWMNNWDYPNNTPTIESDGFNGTDSIVREITLRRTDSGAHFLASRPVAALANNASRTVDLGDLSVNGALTLDYTGTAYELTTTISWEDLTNCGIQLRRSNDGSRHIDVGVHGDYAYVSRRGVANPDTSGKWQESKTPFDATAKKARLRVLVDRTTVEAFFDDGRYTHSMQAFPSLADTGLALFTVGGAAVFENTVIREFSV
ncbi:GH32 C-terminal domain-containing protein [Streptomyces sp. NBC_01725]|uniref:glycoside hydrolase family 32 protein n=1 Tax=Streptomyces sp. NBC_01725 TaxID=2975923 RepID=UPI002E28581C|nr:GH32 C-terminal domain-containing protein [Streptomyces sp. NBC_01725]